MLSPLTTRCWTTVISSVEISSEVVTYLVSYFSPLDLICEDLFEPRGSSYWETWSDLKIPRNLEVANVTEQLWLFCSVEPLAGPPSGVGDPFIKRARSFSISPVCHNRKILDAGTQDLNFYQPPLVLAPALKPLRSVQRDPVSPAKWLDLDLTMPCTYFVWTPCKLEAISWYKIPEHNMEVIFSTPCLSWSLHKAKIGYWRSLTSTVHLTLSRLGKEGWSLSTTIIAIKFLLLAAITVCLQIMHSIYRKSSTGFKGAINIFVHALTSGFRWSNTSDLYLLAFCSWRKEKSILIFKKRGGVRSVEQQADGE